MFATVFPGSSHSHRALLGDLTHALVRRWRAPGSPCCSTSWDTRWRPLLVGVRIWGIRLGIGPTIWQRRIGGCRVHLAAVPVPRRRAAAGRGRQRHRLPRHLRRALALRVGARGVARADHLRGRRAEQSRSGWCCSPSGGMSSAGRRSARLRATSCCSRMASQLRRLPQPAAVFPLRRHPPAGAYPGRPFRLQPARRSRPAGF